MELLQNAEDNAYAESTQPSFEVFLSREDPTHTPGSTGCITIVNNELGFTPADVWNICDAGLSFKKLAKEQVRKEGVVFFFFVRHTQNKQESSASYIGEKGLGFKVCNCENLHVCSSSFFLKKKKRQLFVYLTIRTFFPMVSTFG
jgi:hypothetical protein